MTGPDGCLTLPVILPLLAGTLAALTGSRRFRRAAIPAGLAVGLGCLATGVLVYRCGEMTHTLGGWAPPLGIALRADGLAAFLLVFSGALGCLISLYASAYFVPAGETEPEAASRAVDSMFWPLWFFLWAGLNALFLAADIFNIYVALEVVTLASIALLTLSRSPAAVKAGIRYLVLALLGSLAYLLGVGILYGAGGVLDIDLLAARMDSSFSNRLAAVLITGGVLVKTALFPLHFWLPPAHANAPAPVSAALSGLVVTASFAVLFRLWFSVLQAAPLGALGHLLGILGAVAVIWGGLQALKQSRLKLLIAYSTVSQIGYLFLAFPLAVRGHEGADLAWAGAAFIAVSHGIAKGAAFLLAGAFMRVLGHDRICDLRGVARNYPLAAYAYGIAGVSLMGLPPTGGFIGKWMLLKAAFVTGNWGYAIPLIAGGLLAACYVFRPLEQMFTTSDDESPARDMPRLLSMPPMVLALIAVALSLATYYPLQLLEIGAPFDLVSFDRGMMSP